MKFFIGKESTKNFIIDSIEKSYTLGFLWGDGNLQTNLINNDLYYPRFEILETDFDLIYHHFKVWGEWSIHRRHRKNRQPQVAATLCDKEFGWIVKLGNYIYHDKLSIGLERKYKKFLEIKS